jgi:hypothetical protein
VDDYHQILVDGPKSVPMVVWVTSSIPRPVWRGSSSLGTGDHAIPSLNKVVHSFSDCPGGFRCRHGPAELAR